MDRRHAGDSAVSCNGLLSSPATANLGAAGKGLLPKCFRSIFSSSSLWESRLNHSGEQEDRWNECGADRFGYCDQRGGAD